MRSRRLTATLLTVSLTLLSAAVPPSASLERLRAMPQAERLRLMRKLAEFEALPTAEQARIRNLDHQIQALDPAERQRYQQLIRSYGLWFRTQPRGVRSSLQEAEPAARIQHVHEIRARLRREHDPLDRRVRVFDDRLQVSTLGSEPLLLSALQLRLWFSLEPEQRAKILKPSNPSRQREEFFKAAQASGNLSRFEREMSPRLRSEPKVERREAVLSEALRQRLRSGHLTVKTSHVLRRLEIARLKNSEDPRVEPERLAEFEKHLPPWVRESFDAFPPDSAGRRLRILYRMTFSPGDSHPVTSDL